MWQPAFSGRNENIDPNIPISNLSVCPPFQPVILVSTANQVSVTGQVKGNMDDNSKENKVYNFHTIREGR